MYPFSSSLFNIIYSAQTKKGIPVPRNPRKSLKRSGLYSNRPISKTSNSLQKAVLHSPSRHCTSAPAVSETAPVMEFRKTNKNPRAYQLRAHRGVNPPPIYVCASDGKVRARARGRRLFFEGRENNPSIRPVYGRGGAASPILTVGSLGYSRVREERRHCCRKTNAAGRRYRCESSDTYIRLNRDHQILHGFKITRHIESEFINR